VVEGANVRRRSLLLAGVGTLVTSHALSYASVTNRRETPKPLGRVTIALAASQSLYQLPLTLAERLGYFRDAGLDVTWLPQESGSKALNLAVSAQADVVAGGFEHLFGLQQKGLNFQSFVQMSRTPQVSLGGSTRASTAWQQVADLRGARVGVSALDSTTYWMARQWLKANGLVAEDVVFVEVGSSAGVVDALRSGAIDALCNPDPVMHWLELRNEVRLLAEARSLHGTRQVMGGAVPGACLWAHGDFLQRYPDRVQTLSNGVVHALKWLQTAGLTDILKTVPSNHWMGDRAAYLGAFEKLRESYSLDGLVRASEVQHAWRAHVRLLARAPVMRFVPERTFTNAFAQKSKQRFLA
jgi:NitT/TauT family transport system substrate-binding protein